MGKQGRYNIYLKTHGRLFSIIVPDVPIPGLSEEEIQLQDLPALLRLFNRH